MTSIFNPPLRSALGSRVRWSQLHGAAAGLALASAQARLQAQQQRSVMLVVTEDASGARQLQEEMQFFGGDALKVLNFPAWETLPYDNFSPHQDIVSERLAALSQLLSGESCTLVLPVASLMNRLPPRDFIAGQVFDLKTGDHFDVHATRKRLESCGYRCVDTVCEHGEFALRGAVMDIFPAGSELPYRIDLFDDDIESLRSFDPETQRTVEKVASIRLLPAREFSLTRTGINHFLDRWHDRFTHSDPKQCSLYQDIAAGIAAPGAEYFLPLFFDHAAQLLDYLPDNSLIAQVGDIFGAAEKYQHEIRARYDNLHLERYRPLLKPHEAFVPTDELFAQLKQHARIECHADDDAQAEPLGSAPIPDLALSSRDTHPLLHLQQFLAGHPACRLLVCAESAGRAEALHGLFASHQLPLQNVASWQDFLAGKDRSEQRAALVQIPLDRSLWLPEDNILLLSESQLFGHQVLQKRRRKQQVDAADNAIKHLSELSLGAPVVHIEHGVGRYHGLVALDIGGTNGEFLHLRYASEASLYVPVTSLHMISRYGGADPELAPWHRLGSEQWQKAKEKAAKQIEDVAAHLLEIHARRAARTREAFAIADIEMQQFAAEFPFEETPDQQTAIADVVADMLAGKPMDRLVCGDVGFGKTEVAMRAAFLAAMNGRQVAVLVPTTLLAQQHGENFRDRFAQWPVRIETISRFRTAREQDAVLEKVAEGKIDIIIGTHRLLQEDVKFSNLGLLIIDEEHRFGVKQKERMKAMRAQVDILTMTATPIPRTLNMSMAGMRDLSIIATPPAKRLAIKTFARVYDEATVKEAILRELLRGGQVYFLHNDVSTIETCAKKISELVPEARVTVGHGQMRERDLEQVMSDFYHQRFNVLVCTTIIETGIDVPNANTIIIERADKFGLAQLHQLRGRVGRSHHQAYAYLLTPDVRNMSADAEKRLEAICHADVLGSGFLLANHDLEIRGAGELLGEQQSGQIESIGFTLYMELLERAVKNLKAGKKAGVDITGTQNNEINLRIPALIPENYLPDAATRLVLYRRIACAPDEEGLRDLQVEMIDRFGLLPEEVKNLFRQTALRLQMVKLGIDKLEANTNGLRVEFGSQTQVDPFELVKLIQQYPTRYKLEEGKRLVIKDDLDDAEARFAAVTALLEKLTQ
ncbi:MAG TPA: transcription-repair coupling factor [Pseudomonadales bacterium]|nr:transcription-repair coupling factor [Pseudomonadales bacterium]